MKKLVFTVVLASLIGAAFAAEKKKPLTPEERAARRAKAHEEFIKRTGGKIIDTRKMKGRVVIVNAQKEAQERWLNECAKYFGEQLKVKVDVESGKFSFPDVKTVGEATVFVISDEKLPSLLAAPDNGWAAVNIVPLKQGRGEKPQFFEARVRKEITRAMASACGGIDSAYPGNPVAPVAKLEDIDTFPDALLAVDVLKRMAKYLEAKGVVKYRVTTYDFACQEGWAPEPTNDIQKAVWEEVRKIPSEPIKIKP